MGYEKEGFRGHQYLLEEGEYPDWSHWGGYDEMLTSLRVIRTVSKGNWLIWPQADLPQYNLWREEFVPPFLVLPGSVPRGLASLPSAALLQAVLSASPLIPRGGL